MTEHEGEDRTRIAPERSGGLAPGTILNGLYRIEARLGTGGMGEVYRATNLANDEQDAIKVIGRGLADRPLVEALFRKEARVLRRIQSPAVAPLRLLARDPTLDLLYFAAEFVEGISLLDRLKERPATEAELRGLLRRLLTGIAAVHEAGAVHRDLSPDNVILPGGVVTEAKLIDFGIAKELDPTHTTIIGDGFAGKFGYIAPEQFGYSNSRVGPWTDLYSLALTGIAFAAGKPLDMGHSLGTADEARRRSIPFDAVPVSMRPFFAGLLTFDWQERVPSAAAALALLDRDSVPPTLSPAPPPPPPAPPAPVTVPHAEIPMAPATIRAPTTPSHLAQAAPVTAAPAAPFEDPAAPPTRRGGGRRAALIAIPIAGVAAAVIAGSVIGNIMPGMKTAPVPVASGSPQVDPATVGPAGNDTVAALEAAADRVDAAADNAQVEVAVAATPTPEPSVTPTPRPVTGGPCAAGPYLVFFDYDRAALTSEGETVLANAASAYTDCAPARVRLVSYAGDDENPALVPGRAAAVRRYLAGHGATEARFFVIEGANSEAGPQNRRVEISYAPGSAPSRPLRPRPAPPRYVPPRYVPQRYVPPRPAPRAPPPRSGLEIQKSSSRDRP